MKFNFNENYILENHYVKLRPLEETDFKYLLEYSTNEPELWRYNSDGANGAENLKKYITDALLQRKNEKEYPFIVFNKIKNKYVGSSRFYAFRYPNNIVDIGYTWYGKESQGDGTNKNCKFLMLEFAFEKNKMERVGFAANSLNERSINAMKSIGCKIDGNLRSHSLDNYGNRIDVILLSILRNEWFGNVKENLKSRIATYSKQ